MIANALANPKMRNKIIATLKALLDKFSDDEKIQRGYGKFTHGVGKFRLENYRRHQFKARAQTRRSLQRNKMNGGYFMFDLQRFADTEIVSVAPSR